MKTKILPSSAITDIEVIGAPFDDRNVGSVSIELADGAHDAARFTVNGLSPKAVLSYQNRPVTIHVSLSTHLNLHFHGYINHIEPHSVTRFGLVNGSPITQAEVFCLGPSRDMRGKRTAVWEGYTLAELTQVLAHRYRYSYSVPRDPMRGRWVQRGESDFALLAKAASSLGYRLTIHGTHIHLWDPSKALGRGLPRATLSAPVGADGSMRRDNKPGRIIEMSGSFGTSGALGDAHNKRVSFLDADGNNLSLDADDLDQRSATGHRVRSTVEDEFVFTATSYAQAQRRLESEVKDNVPFHASLTVLGVPWVVPGSMVDVTGYRSHYDGYWLVRSIKHSIVRDNYVSELEVTRDTISEGGAAVSPPVITAKPPPEPTLVGSVWKSSFVSEETYV